MRIVWKFGDGSVQFTYVDPAARRTDESEDQQAVRLRTKMEGTLLVSSVGLDKRIRLPEDQAAYVTALGAGAFATYAGVISDSEYIEKFNNFRMFREGYTWVTDDPIIEFDMAKCREIHRHDLRRARALKMAALDVAYQRADEIGNAAEKQRIAAEKQVLRDITAHPGIEAAQTLDELISVGVMLMKVQP